MKQKDHLGLVPAQYTGNEIEPSASAELPDEKTAILFFDAAKQRLLNVNNWHAVAGFVSAKFQAVDKSGNEVSRDLARGEFIRIDIPGPGSKEGDGYDWVQVEEMKEILNGSVQSLGFRVRPVANPNGNPKNIAHFYSSESTSTFMVSREGKIVSAYIIDRNTKPNDETESITDYIRHMPVAMGAISMFSKAQWQNLANGLVARKE